jgi:hypothetical protein
MYPRVSAETLRAIAYGASGVRTGRAYPVMSRSKTGNSSMPAGSQASSLTRKAPGLPGVFLSAAILGLREYPQPRYCNGATRLPAIRGIAHISVIRGIARSG